MKTEKADIKESVKSIKLLALDMDGTVLNENRECDERTAAVIQRLLNKGYIVAISTGRAYQGLAGELLPVNGIEYVISSDGARLTECASGRCLYSCLIPCETAAELADELFRVGIRVTLQHDYKSEGRPYITAAQDPDKMATPGSLWKRTPNINVLRNGLGDLIRSEGRGVSKIGVWFNRLDGPDYYKKKFLEKYPDINSFLTEAYELEFTARGADKGRALAELRKYLDLKDGEILAIGDGENDIAMFSEADFSAAMGNASDEAKKNADIVIGRNNEDGLAAFLEEYFL